MPLPFTNIWDSSQPADSDLVAEGANDFRTVRTDVQQRMAAISGLDAQKPTFGNDVQPTQWAGVLFFATDTARVYQWTGAFWADVTISIGSGGGAGSAGVIDRQTVPKVFQNTTTEAAVYTTLLPVLTPTSILRVTTYLELHTIAAAFGLSWHFAWPTPSTAHIMEVAYDPIQPGGTPGPALSNTVLCVQLSIQNTGSQSAQITTGVCFSLPLSGMDTTLGVYNSSIDTTQPQQLNMTLTDNAAGNSQTFLNWLVELL